MDLRLPDMSGIDAAVAIRTEFPEARIIILTTFDADTDQQRALSAGASAFVLKSGPPRNCWKQSARSTLGDVFIEATGLMHHAGIPSGFAVFRYCQRELVELLRCRRAFFRVRDDRGEARVAGSDWRSGSLSMPRSPSVGNPWSTALRKSEIASSLRH